MNRLLRAGIVVVVLISSPAWAAQLALTLNRSAWGQWQAFGQLSNNTDNDGLSSLIIDVQAAGGDLGVSSSTCQLPYGTHYWLDGNVQSQLVGFTEFRSNGTNGTGVRAGQKTTSLGQVVLTDVGYSDGNTPGDETGQELGPTLISWSAPALIASGSYSGLYGTLSVTVGAGQVNVLDEGRDPSQPGGVHQIESVLAGQLRILHPGDAGGDDKVDSADLSDLTDHWKQTGMTWAQGDFSGDGVVDSADLSDLTAYWGWSAPSPPPGAPLGSALPEPISFILLGLGAPGLLCRRRRSR
jgi:hypothetical protein